MSNLMLVVLLAAFFGSYHVLSQRKLKRRFRDLERDLQSITDVVSKVAEVQTTKFEKHSSRFEELEERILEMSVPSQDSEPPLERRHQVLSLARQGMGLDDIVKRLKAPVGETELILNLSKYQGRKSGRTRAAEQRIPYA